MFAMNLVTGPSFLGGLLYGINKRVSPEYKPDPYAHYKLLSLTSGIGFLKVIATEEAPKSTPVQLVRSGIIGGILMSGTIFCMGMMMTKIPGPIFTNEETKKQGVSIKLF